MDLTSESAADAVGCTDYFVWTVAPDFFATKLTDAVKRYSRFLKKSGLSATHTEGMELLARASGFPHWHAMQTPLQGFKAATPVQRAARLNGKDPLVAFERAFPFLVETKISCPPSPKELVGLSKAAAQLAAASGRPLAQLQDMVGRMNGADTWHALLSRLPKDAPGPLYTFEVNESGNGSFEVSDACSALIQEQDELFQYFPDLSEREREKFCAQLDAVLARRPDFLEGLLARAEVMQTNPLLHADIGKVYDLAIVQANALIPKNFGGEISWYEMGNRFYLRLLYGAMVWNAHAGNVELAVLLAGRQLLLNPSDNLGARLWLPVLFSAQGLFEAADEACTRLTQEKDYTDAHVELVRAICHFGSGRTRLAAKSMFSALFHFPPSRHAIGGDYDSLREGVKRQTRLVRPDFETMADQFAIAAGYNPNLAATFDEWLASPDLKVLETEVASFFRDVRNGPDGSYVRWMQGVERHAAKLSMQMKL